MKIIEIIRKIMFDMFIFGFYIVACGCYGISQAVYIGGITITRTPNPGLAINFFLAGAIINLAGIFLYFKVALKKEEKNVKFSAFRLLFLLAAFMCYLTYSIPVAEP